MTIGPRLIALPALIIAISSFIGPLHAAQAPGSFAQDLINTIQTTRGIGTTSVKGGGHDTPSADADGDGIEDNADLCPNTPAGETVDSNGCSDSQKDSDSDGVNDDADLCPDTPSGEQRPTACLFDHDVGTHAHSSFSK